MSVHSSQLGPPQPPTQINECVPPPGTGRGGGGVTLACGRGGGQTHFGRLERKPGTLSTLCKPVSSVRYFSNLLVFFCTMFLLFHVQTHHTFPRGMCLLPFPVSTLLPTSHPRPEWLPPPLLFTPPPTLLFTPPPCCGDLHVYPLGNQKHGGKTSQHYIYIRSSGTVPILVGLKKKEKILDTHRSRTCFC